MSAPTPDDPRDAHLVAALRHAPDRDVAPPAQLSAAILEQAQRALRSQRPAPASGWRLLWERLWQPAPMAAFGTLAMGTLIGVMWGAQEPPDATPSLRPEAVAAAPAKPRADAPAVIGAVQPPAPSPVARAAEAAPAERSAAVAKTTARAPSAPAPSLRSAKADPLSTASDRAVDANVAAPEVRQAAAVSEAAQASTMAPAPAPAALPVPAPTTAIVAPQAVPQVPDRRRDALAKSLADAAPPAARSRSEAMAPALGAARLALPSPLAAADIAAAMAGDAQRVGWRVGAERTVAHEAAQREWWSALARATQGRWQPAAASAAEGASVALLIDGALRAALAFEPQALVWREANGAVWRVSVEPALLREWQEALARW
jgi:hypothetical protein